MKLKNSVVLVTGSSSGIGRETAIQFAKSGSKVVLTYNTGKKAGEEALEECMVHGPALLTRLDVRDARSIYLLLDRVFHYFGGIDILVNNAGVIRWTELVKQTDEEIWDQVQVNLLGVIQVTRAFLPQFLKQRSGVVVNISSAMGKETDGELAVYCATKWGVRGFTKALASELPKSIRAYCVNPAMTATGMTDYRGVDPAMVAEVIIRTAEEKLGVPSGGDVDVWKYL